MPHNYYSLHNFVDHKNVDQIEYIYTTFSRSLLVTLQHIRSLSVTFSGNYFTSRLCDLIHGKSIPSVT